MLGCAALGDRCAATATFSDLTWSDTDQHVAWQGGGSSMLVDADGSLTGLKAGELCSCLRDACMSLHQTAEAVQVQPVSSRQPAMQYLMRQPVACAASVHALIVNDRPESGLVSACKIVINKAELFS